MSLDSNDTDTHHSSSNLIIKEVTKVTDLQTEVLNPPNPLVVQPILDGNLEHEILSLSADLLDLDGEKALKEFDESTFDLLSDQEDPTTFIQTSGQLSCSVASATVSTAQTPASYQDDDRNFDDGRYQDDYSYRAQSYEPNLPPSTVTTAHTPTSYQDHRRYQDDNSYRAQSYEPNLPPSTAGGYRDRYCNNDRYRDDYSNRAQPYGKNQYDSQFTQPLQQLNYKQNGKFNRSCDESMQKKKPSVFRRQSMAEKAKLTNTGRSKIGRSKSTRVVRQSTNPITAAPKKS